MTELQPQNWFDERVEAFLDGDLPSSERSLFEARLNLDAALRREVKRAKQIQLSLRNIPEFRCPDDVRKRVIQITGSAALGHPWRWVGAACTGLIAAVAVGILIPTPGPDAAELAKARADMEIALAYLNRAGQVAGHQAGLQWIESGIARPVSAGLRRQSPADEETI